MPGFIVRLLITAAGLWLAATLVSGIVIEGTGTLLGAALLLGVVNAVVRPIAVVLTLPITILTLGIFLWVINAAMLGLTATFLSGFAISGLFPALIGSAIVSFTGWIGSSYIGSNGRYEIITAPRDRD